MKVAYIAHPIGGDVERNLQKIKWICREINLNEPDVVPFAPYYLDCVSMDDNNPSERDRCIKNDKELFYRGFIDELRVYGNNISNGVAAEIQLAFDLGITVRLMKRKLFDEFRKFIPIEYGGLRLNSDNTVELIKQEVSE